jgi:hypothetical protein
MYPTGGPLTSVEHEADLLGARRSPGQASGSGSGVDSLPPEVAPSESFVLGSSSPPAHDARVSA